MKKFLLTAIAASSILFANAVPAFNWAYAIDSKYANDQIGAVISTSDNKVVTVSHFASKDGETFTYDEEAIGTPLATSTESRNLVIIKHDTNGKKIWAVYSKQGYFDAASCAVVATPDGGVVVYAKPRGSQVGTSEYAQPQLIDNSNNEIDFADFPVLNWTYNTILFKISGDGNIEWSRQLAIDELPLSGTDKATTDGVDPKALTVDGEGNIFIAGNFRAPMILKGQKYANYVIQPRNANSGTTTGGLYLIKLNSDGEYLGQLAVSGASTRESIGSLVYDNGNLYFAGNVLGKEGTEVTVGDKSITLANGLDGIIYGSVDAATLSVNFVGYAKALGAALDGKQTTQIKAVRVIDNNLYVLGSFKGGFAVGDASIAAEETAKTALQNGFIIKFSAEDGSWLSGKTLTDKYGTAQTIAITALFDVFKYNGKVYVYGYAMNKDLGVYVAQFSDDSSWTLEEQNYLVSQGSTPLTAAGVAVDSTTGDIVVSARGKGEFTFLGTETKYTTLENAFGCVLASFNLSGTSGVNSVAADAAATISADKTSVVVKTASPLEVNIYSTAGVLVASQTVAAGTTHIALPQGIYVVNNTKVIVG